MRSRCPLAPAAPGPSRPCSPAVTPPPPAQAAKKQIPAALTAQPQLAVDVPLGGAGAVSAMPRLPFDAGEWAGAVWGGELAA